MMSKKDDDQTESIERGASARAKGGRHLHLVKSEEVSDDDLVRDLKALGEQILDEPLPERLLDALRKAPLKDG
jgi:hypothetical protein